MKLIVATDRNGGIGYENRLPWDKIQGDLARFKSLTTNQTVIMGRNTWDSLPKKPLPNRINIVISSRPLEDEYPNVIRATDMSFNRPDDVDFWLIGGAKLIESCWELVNEVYLTKTHDIYPCDVYISLDYISKNFVKLLDQENSDHNYQIWKRK